MEIYIDASLLLGYESMGPLQHLIFDLIRNAHGIYLPTSLSATANDACHQKLENLKLQLPLYDTLPSTTDVLFTLNNIPKILPTSTYVVVCAPEPANKVYAAHASAVLAILTDTLPEELPPHTPGHIKILWNNRALVPLKMSDPLDLAPTGQIANAIVFIYDSREIFADERPFKQVWDNEIDTTHQSLIHLLPTLQKNKNFILLDIANNHNWRTALESVQPKLYWNAVTSPSIAIHIRKLAHRTNTPFLDWHNRALSPIRYFLEGLSPEIYPKTIHSVSEKFKNALQILKFQQLKKDELTESSSTLKNDNRLCEAQDILTALQERIDGKKHNYLPNNTLVFADKRDAIVPEENFEPLDGAEFDTYMDANFRFRWHEVMQLLPANSVIFDNMMQRTVAANVQCYATESWIRHQQKQVSSWSQWLQTCENTVCKLYEKNYAIKDAYAGLAAIKRTDPTHVAYYLNLEEKCGRMGPQYYIERTLAYALADHADYEKTLQIAIHTHRWPQIARSMIGKILFDLGQPQRALALFESDHAAGRMITPVKLDYLHCLTRSGDTTRAQELFQS